MKMLRNDDFWTPYYEYVVGQFYAGNQIFSRLFIAYFYLHDNKASFWRLFSTWQFYTQLGISMLTYLESSLYICWATIQCEWRDLCPFSSLLSNFWNSVGHKKTKGFKNAQKWSNILSRKVSPKKWTSYEYEEWDENLYHEIFWDPFPPPSCWAVTLNRVEKDPLETNL